MARFILKWRYIKSNSAGHSTNLVKYIATREGVERCDESWKYQSATDEQQRLIKELVNDFPESAQSFEYQDYINSPTKSNASEFISRVIEENVDLVGKKENYVGYIAMRPRVEKQGSHGMFSQKDEVINLKDVAKTVAEHDGAVWTTIMSLRREDAEMLGYDNAKAWRDMLRSKAPGLSKAMGIPLADLRWYAAFHNEGNHPHIHLISYSAGKEPYMTEQGLQTFKSDFAHEIFKNDFYHIYENLNTHRDELRRTGREKISDIVKQINSNTYENETVVLMLKELAKQLENYKGKTVYGYMPKKAKNLINGIIDELAKDKRIEELYNLWYEQKENIVKTYQDALPQRIPLSQNKEFRPIKNAVIKEALNILHDTITFEDDTFDYADTPVDESTAKRNPWSDSNDMHYQYLKGKSLMDKDSEEYNPEEAVRWLKLSAMQGFDIAMYRLGKIYFQGDIVEKNIGETLRWLWEAEEKNNEYAQYLLGKIYLKGEGVSIDFLTAENMFEKAVLQGNMYAQYSLAKMHLQGKAQNSSISTAVQLLIASAKNGNQWAEYQLGKMYLYGQGVNKNQGLAIQYLTSAADKGNEYAKHLLNNDDYHSHSSVATVLASMRLLARLSQIIRDDTEKRSSTGRSIDRKLMRKIEEKKMAQGQKMG